MKYICVLFTIVLTISFSLHSTPYNSLENKQEKVISNLFDQLVQHQINSNMAIERSVNALLKSYPEQIDIVLKVALSKYPQEYKQIMCGALRAEPALASDVITILLKSNIATSTDIVSIAINEEPAYAKEIVNTAVFYYPDELESIVRVAILTGPVMANNVVNNTMLSYPEKLLDILIVAVKALPDQVTNIVRDTLRLSSDNSGIISVAVSSSNREKTREIIATAIQSGMSKESATAAAIAGGAKLADIVRITP